MARSEKRMPSFRRAIGEVARACGGIRIGTKDVARQRGLVLEQGLFIKELRLMQEHMERLDMEVAQIVEHSREGRILLSIPPICPLYAAAILATIGQIANFEDAGHLKSYFGWAPKRAQTGVSFDRTSLTKGGSREMKKVMYLVAWNAIKAETQWASLYKRLVPRLCTYDERTQTYKGKGKALGHVIGRLITLVYALLKQDDEMLSHLPPRTEPPEPVLYDPDLHKRHRTGHYRPIRKDHATNRIVQVEP
jgi:Transposase IS116/IS110/IS902 family